jgi:hypothetical protein
MQGEGGAMSFTQQRRFCMQAGSLSDLGDRLQKYLSGPYFTSFLVNSSLLTLRIR